MLKSFISADTQFIENKHTGKYISNLNFDVNQITGMLSTSFLTLFKDGLTLIGLLTVMFFQNWRLSLIAIIMIPLASIAAKSLGKRMGKVSTQAQERSGFLNKHLVEIFKNHKLIKIFQKENFESNRSDELISNLANKVNKISKIPVIGIVASNKCDCQILVTEDLLVLLSKSPKFAKKYESFRIKIRRAVTKYSKEVKTRKFPSKYNTFR